MPTDEQIVSLAKAGLSRKRAARELGINYMTFSKLLYRRGLAVLFSEASKREWRAKRLATNKRKLIEQRSCV